MASGAEFQSLEQSLVILSLAAFVLEIFIVTSLWNTEETGDIYHITKKHFIAI